MAKASLPTWTVHPHGSLEALEDNLWRLEGSLPGMPLRRVMTVARLASGDLVVHNPIAVDDATRAKLESLGRIAYLVIPNGWHRLDLHAFHAKYPDAIVLAPRGSHDKVAEVDSSVRDLTALPSDPNVTLSIMDGTKDLEAVMTVKSGGAVSVVLTDAVFNMPHLSGVKGWVLRHITQSSGGPRISRIARLLLVKDKAAFAAHLERLATSELRRVIVSHHETITDDPAGTLRRVAASVR